MSFCLETPICPKTPNYGKWKDVFQELWQNLEISILIIMGTFMGNFSPYANYGHQFKTLNLTVETNKFG
jgi:hypothetical protein